MAGISLRAGLALVVLALGAFAEDGTVLQLHGSGTTNPSKLFWKVCVSECRLLSCACVGLHITPTRVCTHMHQPHKCVSQTWCGVHVHSACVMLYYRM